MKKNKSLPFNIVLTGFLVCIGMLIDAYIKIGYNSFAILPIYILVGIILPIHFGLTAGVLIDTLSQVLQGQIGGWWWSFAIQPIIIILITKVLYLIFNKKQIKPYIWYISLLFSILVATLGITYIVLNSSDFGSNKTDKVITAYLRVLGFAFITLWLTWMVFRFKNHENRHDKLVSLLLIVLIAILIDWFINPLSAMEWHLNAPNAYAPIKSWNNELFNTFIWMGIGKSLLHIFIGLGILSGTMIAIKAHLIKR